MPPTPPKPRIPGSQVAPGQRPLYRDAPTASTHSKLPIDQATAGKTYRVRDKDWAALHGEGLSWDEATRLKDHVASKGHRTARVEDEAIPPPEWYAAPAAGGPPGVTIVTEWSREDKEHVATTSAYPSLSWLAPTAAEAADGLRRLIRDLGSDGEPSTPAADPELEALRQGAFSAARQAAEAANARVGDNGAAARAEHLARMTGVRPVVRPVVVSIPVAAPVAPPPPPPASKWVAPQKVRAAPPPNPNRIVPRDKTVQGEVFRRREPPPRDRTATSEVLKRAHAPVSAPPRPLISPQKAAEMLDDPLDIPDNAVVGDDDLSDLVSDLGGGASDKDVERAKAQADAERRARG